LEESVLQQTNQVRFKHLCGEYCTAISFALWLGASILKKQIIPDAVKFSTPSSSKLKTILIANHYMNKNYSFILLKKR
ncbi:MAG: 3-oxoacyl-ACP synthase, partial [Marivirga sp.]|nr:3-oxoacyl-ACP synthase [Marivirga sp.]